ncbi:MAG: DNA polymerase IV, partial [Thermoplasmata archaeon]|nr:DNA polymerase IV [Thermoplasmata archaeon]
MERIILHMDMNAFFASVEQATNPALKNRPILVGGNPKKRSVVAAASYEAKAKGVKAGMSWYEARRLCPEAIMIEGTPIKYIDTATKIFIFLRDYTPKVEVFSIDEAFLDITHTAHLFGTPRDLALSIKKRIKKMFNITCSIGIGPNKLISKLAANMEKPDGLTIIKEEDVPALLDNLPVDELSGIGDKFKAHLNRMGIKTCGDLQKMPL